MTNGTRRRWLKGCTIGCGAVVLALIVVAAIVGWKIGVATRPIRLVEAVHLQLIDRYGESIDYVPAHDGAIPSQRLETFIAIRESLREASAELRAGFADFPPDALIHDDTSSVFAKISSAVGMLDDLIRGIGRYVNARHQALLDNEMGVGEYVYIYSMAYHSWLGYPVTAGPVITKVVHRTASGWSTGDSFFKEDHDTYSTERLWSRYRWYLTSMLENQLETLPEGTDESWRDLLAAEIVRMRSDDSTVAWEQVLPEPIQDSLQPFRERLEAVYDPMSNCFEIPPEDHEPPQS